MIKHNYSLSGIRNAAAIFLMAAFPGFVAADGTVRVSDLDLSKAYQQYGGVSKGRAVTGEKPSVGGQPVDEVIGVHARSILKINLHRNATLFRTSLGVADCSVDYRASDIMTIPLADGKKVFYKVSEQNKQFVGIEGNSGSVDRGNVLFRIVGDGKELFSQTRKSGEAPVPVELSLKDVNILELVAEEAEDGPSGDFALWIAPQIDYFEIAPVMVDPDFAGEPVEIDSRIRRTLESKVSSLPEIAYPLPVADYDWLITPQKAQAGVYQATQGKEIVLSNGLVARTFRILPNLATVDMVNQMNGERLLRTVGSEGMLTIDGNVWSLGGLQGEPERGYTRSEWLDQLRPMPNSFLVEDFAVTALAEDIAWARSRWALNKKAPSGKRLTFSMRGTDQLSALQVKLHYDLYDGLPLIRKSLEVYNEGDIPFNLDAFKLEYLPFVEEESLVEAKGNLFRIPNISIESDYAFGGFTEKESDKTEKWVVDPAYTSQVNYAMNTPCILDVSVPIGPDQLITRNMPFESFHVYEMPYDSYDRERKGLFKRRMYRTVAPWTSENPIFMHLTTIDPDVVKQAVDQCVETGYEMIILSFGSGLDMENVSDENIARIRELSEYARSKGIELGGYSLLSSRWISDEVDVINPETGKRGGMIFGSSPCLCSDWGFDYFNKIRTFCEKAGIRVFEHDGSYPGNVCASTTHTHHNGLNDSQWKQFKKITELYKWMCESGIYINVPDYYFLNGSTKTGIGYREVNWSLPRERQLIHGRQVNFNGTWDRPGAACWTFVPLVEYHGGGAAATLEPLNEHLDTYRAHMIQNYGAGIQACYRGPRLYDTDTTKQVVQEVITWYKKYRNILNSDIIHLRKADGRDWDGILHVNPEEKEKGFALFFNPTDQPITRVIKVPLYYTGLTEKTRIREQEGKSRTLKLNRDYTVDLTVTIPAQGNTWFVFE